MIPQRCRFKDLDEQHILALAISSEEDDARIYRGFAARLRDDFPKLPHYLTIWQKKRTAIAQH